MSIHQGRFGRSGSADRTIQDMVVAANTIQETGGVEQADGWRRPLGAGTGFRYSYNRDIGDGGWEFHYLSDAVSVVAADFKAAQSISRMHRLDDHLVFSAVLEGRIPISAPDAPNAELTNGFCTVYGLARGEPLKTVYEPGRALRWVSVFLRRDKLQELCGLDGDAMPPMFRDFIVGGAPTGLRSVPLSGAARMAASQIFSCDYAGEIRRLYLTAKAIEIVCAALHALGGERGPRDRSVLSRREVEKVWAARAIIERNLETPLGVPELARTVGLGRRKLQLGFQQAFNASVGQVCKQARLARAMAMVGDTDVPLIEIALECGYEHAASFTRAFKAAFGEGPARVRALLQERKAGRTIGGQAGDRRH